MEGPRGERRSMLEVGEARGRGKEGGGGLEGGCACAGRGHALTSRVAPGAARQCFSRPRDQSRATPFEHVHEFPMLIL